MSYVQLLSFDNDQNILLIPADCEAEAGAVPPVLGDDISGFGLQHLRGLRAGKKGRRDWNRTGTGLEQDWKERRWSHASTK